MMSEGAAAGPVDYRIYYNLESYLFETVNGAFHKDGYLSTFDFFCIVVWKANRAKSKIAARLMSRGHTDIDSAVRELTKGINQESEPKDKLRYLLANWGFRLPMATAILTVLCPEEFTVYDTRVCDQLGDFANLTSVTRFDHLWSAYERFVERVHAKSPATPRLRDKDRYLWGKSFFEHLMRDIEQTFHHYKGSSIDDPAI